MTGRVSPRYHEIAGDLRDQITAGHVQPGERLPSELALAGRYEVSTVTLRHALALLQGEGLLVKVHGKGNFVRRPLRKITYVGGWGTMDLSTAAGPSFRVTVRSASVQASAYLADLLRVPPGSPLAEFFCLGLEGEVPRGLARIYLPRDLAQAEVFDDDSDRREAIARFAVLGPSPAVVRETVSVRLPTADEAAALRIGSQAAVLAVTRLATDPAGRVLEAALLAFPGDRVEAVFTVHHMAEERKTGG
ncbi:GntR family transcriptional regulator [Streptomyces sp. SID8352]|uniref:GntR family transcriptional regulator n=1 Tax=Streptomyces sp. SID8352 TaxID=2690338 RepID=UPI001372007D|nr:UTRA domain-containing protein [Streptomyces sp. SID8352]